MVKYDKIIHNIPPFLPPHGVVFPRGLSQIGNKVWDHVTTPIHYVIYGLLQKMTNLSALVMVA